MEGGGYEDEIDRFRYLRGSLGGQNSADIAHPSIFRQSFDLPQRFGVDVDRIDYPALARLLGQREDERPVAGTDVGDFMPRRDLQSLDDAGDRTIINRRRDLVPHQSPEPRANEQKSYNNRQPFFDPHLIPPSRRPRPPR